MFSCLSFSWAHVEDFFAQDAERKLTASDRARLGPTALVSRPLERVTPFCQRIMVSCLSQWTVALRGIHTHGLEPWPLRSPLSPLLDNHRGSAISRSVRQRVGVIIGGELVLGISPPSRNA